MSKRPADSSACPSNKKVKRACKFQDKWTTKFACIAKRVPNSCFAKHVTRIFSINSGGHKDLTRHLSSKAQTSNTSSSASTPLIQDAFKPTISDPVAKAKCTFVPLQAEMMTASSTGLMSCLFPARPLPLDRSCVSLGIIAVKNK
ncbi:hypothetical protein DPMN_105720 [Dreissena polymorpha]|uniref:Uncharacterized protein n=1 Tax=Dreissena polymorpha TaxID=45954 RepID=A0A9D4K3P6_DREPO|nr:hypothetical protein DPMN_105720 [Dreissena polymorpha]